MEHCFSLVFIATLLFAPSMPVREKLSYGTQLGALKKNVMWYSILALTLINGALVFLVASLVFAVLRIRALRAGQQFHPQIVA